MIRLLLATMALALPVAVGAQTIVAPIPNTASTSPGTSYAVPRVGENVDEAASAGERASRADARTPGPTTRRDQRRNEAAHKRQDRRHGDPR